MLSSSVERVLPSEISQELFAKDQKSQMLIFSNLPLSVKKQIWHLLRTNKVEFKPSIRNGFVEAKIFMEKEPRLERVPGKQAQRLVIGDKEYRQLLGQKYAVLRGNHDLKNAMEYDGKL